MLIVSNTNFIFPLFSFSFHYSLVVFAIAISSGKALKEKGPWNAVTHLLTTMILYSYEINHLQ
jgi:amino acid permease